jgi:hypothetical protein
MKKGDAMITTRCAYFLGKPVAGKEAEFKAAMSGMAGIFGSLPGVKFGHLEWPFYFETDAIGVYAVMRLHFERPEDIDVMIASPERNQARAKFAEQVLPLFEGKVTHINYQADQYGA